MILYGIVFVSHGTKSGWMERDFGFNSRILRILKVFRFKLKKCVFLTVVTADRIIYLKTIETYTKKRDK